MPDPTLSAKRIAFAILVFLCIQQQSFSQTPVTGVYTDFDGFWKSESAQPNSIKPDRRHNLLAFTWNGKVFSTRANDSILNSRKLDYQPVSFRAFTLNKLPIDTPSTRLILAEDAEALSAATGNPTRLLTDGLLGLDLGSGLAKVPVNNFEFNTAETSIRAGAVGDGIPDILITQITAPSGSADRIYFVDKFGNRLGIALTFNFNSGQTIGNWTANAYDAKGKLLEQNIEQPIMAQAADLADFGITETSAASIVAMRYDFAGSSAPAFIAFNNASIGGPTRVVATPRITTEIAPLCCEGPNTKALTVSPYVSLQNDFSRQVQQAGIPITVSIFSGPANHGPLTGTTTELTTAQGDVNFRNMYLPCEEGTYVLVFSSGSLFRSFSPPILVKKPIYYPLAGRENSLSDPASWRTGEDGTGTAPTDFAADKIFVMSNSSGETEFRTGSRWTVGGKLIIPAGKRLTIDPSSRLSIQCTLENNGTVAGERGSWLDLIGSTRQTLNGKFDLKSVFISNNGSVRLMVPISIDTLMIRAGRLFIGDNDIFVNRMMEGSPQSYVRTDGEGKVLSVVDWFDPKEFMVGNVFYNPVTINIQRPFSDTIAVRVLDDVRVNGTYGDIITEPRVKATWNIESSDARKAAAAVANGEPYTPVLVLGFQLRYSSLQNTGIGLPALYAYDGGWRNITTRYSTCTFACPYPQVSGFRGTTSLFYMGTGNVTLPVSFEKFTAELIQNNARLNWQTAHEYNIRDYSVMYSSDGINWKVAGNMSLRAERNYNFAWNGLVNGKNYFRIRENDKDGNYSYSAVQVLEVNRTNNFSASNPAVNGSTTLTLDHAMQVSLFDPAGRLIWKRSFSAGSHRVALGTVQPGIYLLKYDGGISRLMVP